MFNLEKFEQIIKDYSEQEFKKVDNLKDYYTNKLKSRSKIDIAHRYLFINSYRFPESCYEFHNFDYSQSEKELGEKIFNVTINNCYLNIGCFFRNNDWITSHLKNTRAFAYFTILLLQEEVKVMEEFFPFLKESSKENLISIRNNFAKVPYGRKYP